MSAKGQNEGFYFLEDSVCKAISTLPDSTTPKSFGQNEGVTALDEVIVDLDQDKEKRES